MSRLFEELLERPLTGFDARATYSVFHNVGIEFFANVSPTTEQLSGQERFTLEPEFDDGAEPRNPVDAVFWRTSHYPVNLADSLLIYECAEYTPACLRSLCQIDPYGQYIVSGRIVAENVGENLGSALELVRGYAFHVETDGTLFDAMRTVFHLGAPDSLLSNAAAPESVTWIKEQVSVPHFQEHIRALFAVRDSFLEVPGSDEISAVVLRWGQPILSLFTGEGGWYWNIVKRA